jgi:hypothetical protein
MSFPFDNFEVPFSLMSQGQASTMEDSLAPILRSLNQPRSPLNEAFFGIMNMDVLQNRLRVSIQKQTGYAIDRQSDTDLTVIMRKVYAEQAAHRPDGDVQAEVNRLNDMVLHVAVPMVASGVAGYLAYLKDASRLPEPIPRGSQTSVKGTKTYELFRGI